MTRFGRRKIERRIYQFHDRYALLLPSGECLVPLAEDGMTLHYGALANHASKNNATARFVTVQVSQGSSDTATTGALLMATRAIQKGEVSGLCRERRQPPFILSLSSFRKSLWIIEPAGTKIQMDENTK